MNDGLTTKYHVLKAKTGEVVENCFVLRPDKDWAARYAVKAYADMTCNTKLAKDLLKWIETFPVSSYDPDDAHVDLGNISLKPCPRCGGKGIIYREGPKYYYAECEFCPLELHDIYFSAEKAAEAWNYRKDPPNPPLTLEELREMDGEPVWIFYGEGIGLYDVFCGVSTDDIAQFYKLALPISTYERTWLAYRRKPEEGKT